MLPTITTEGFRVPWSWSREEHAERAAELAELSRTATFHGFTIEDAAGQRLATPGAQPCATALRAFDGRGFPRDFNGAGVVDVGCNGGFFSVVARLRGAAAVLGVDPLAHCIGQANFLARTLRLDGICFRVGDESSIERVADVMLNLGVLYHTRDPFAFLRRCAASVGRTMVLETEMLLDESAPGAWFIEDAYAGDPTNWWIPGRRCVEGMARAAGFRSIAFQGISWRPPPGALTPEGYERQGRGVFICEK